MFIWPLERNPQLFSQAILYLCFMGMEKVDNPDYLNWVSEIKSKIQSAQIKAALSVNHEMIRLYWDLGLSISEKLKKANWGSGVVEQLSKDLKKTFPDHKGYSRSNLFYMKRLVEFYADSDEDIEKIQQLVGQIPWGHSLPYTSFMADKCLKLQRYSIIDQKVNKPESQSKHRKVASVFSVNFAQII